MSISRQAAQNSVGMHKYNIYAQIYEPEPIRIGLFKQTFESVVTMTDYRDVITKHMVDALDEINSRIEYVPQREDIPGHLPRDLSTDQFLANLLTKTEKELEDLYNAMKAGRKGDLWLGIIDFIKKGYFSYQLGISNLSSLRPSPVPGLKESPLEYIRTSALHGHGSGLMIASLAFTEIQNESTIPVRLNLTLLALSHSSLAIRRLHSRWPDLYAMVRKVLRERGLDCLEEAKAIHPDLYQSVQLVKLYCAQPTRPSLAGLAPLTLDEAVEIGAYEEIRDMLDDADYNITAETAPAVLKGETLEGAKEPTIHSLFHRFSKLSDADAGSLARTAFERGARLDYLRSIAITNQPITGDLPRPYSPLCVALMRGQPTLAFQIVCLHVEFDVPIPQFYTAMQLAVAKLYPEVAELLLRLRLDNPAMCTRMDEDVSYDDEFGDSPARALSLMVLNLGLQSANWETVMLHEGGYEAAYARTLRFFLDEGAGPVWGPPGITPLGFSICTDDVMAVKLYIDHLETIASNDDHVDVSDVVLAVLNDPCNMLGLIRDKDDEHFIRMQYVFTALALCLRHGSLRCFEFFLEKAPGLATAETDFLERTLLHRACCGVEKLHRRINDDALQHNLLTRAGVPLDGAMVEFVDLLLKSGADVMAADYYGHTPLYWALMRANIAAADRIVSYCSQDQLDLLLGRDPRTGASIFKSLVVYDVVRYTGKEDEQRQPRLVESLRWLVERGAVYYDGPEHMPLYTLILLQDFRTERTDQLLDAALMEYLIDLPLYVDGLQTERPGGLPLIYAAIAHGNVEIVRLLLDRNCDPNGGYYAETQAEAKQWGTPLDYVPQVLIRGWNALKEMEHASKPEFRKWQDRMLDIANLLLDRGARSDIFDVENWMDISFKLNSRQIHPKLPDPKMSENILKQQAVLGAWPKPLPTYDYGSGVSAASTADDISTDRYLTYYLFQAAFTRMKERRLGRMGIDQQLLFAECYYAEAVGDQPFGRDNSNATGELSRVKTASIKSSEVGLPDGITKLHIAVRHGDVSGLMDALDSADDVDAEDSKGRSPLDSALLIRSSHTRAVMVQLLLQAGANPDRIRSSSSSLSTPLHRCIRRRDDPELVRILVTAGANLDILNGVKLSPLILAVAYGREAALAVLLSAGADITQRSAEGQSLVHLAVMYGNPRILSLVLKFLPSDQADTAQKRLVDAGIEGNRDDRDGNATRSHSLLKHHEYFQPGRGPMHIAACAGLITIMRILINEGGADPNVKDSVGKTPLHHAVINAPLEAVEMLIDEAGLDLHARDTEQATPLVSWVIKYGRDKGKVDTRIRDLLLARGANVNDLAEFRFFIRTGDEHGFSYHHVGKGKEELVSPETLFQASGTPWVEWDPWIALRSG